MPSGGVTPSSGDSTVPAIEGLIFNVTDPAYGGGAKGNGTTDDTAPILAVVAAAVAAGGGIVFFPVPPSFYRFDGLLNLDGVNNVALVGAATVRNQYRAMGGAFLKRVSGTGPMLSWKGNGTNSIVGARIENLGFDCNSLATSGLTLLDWYGCSITNVYVRNATTVNVDLIGQNSLGWQNNVVVGLDIRANEAANGIGMRWNSVMVGDGNVSLNVWEKISIYHKNGVGLDCGDSDSNILTGFECQNVAGGTGVGVLLRGSGTLNSGHCRHNMFFGAQPVSGVTAQATALTQPSASNSFYITSANSVPSPTIESGATLSWVLDTGATTITGSPALDFGTGTIKQLVSAPVVFTATGTWTPSTTGQQLFAALVVGGGGGGGQGGSATGGSAGGGGQVLNYFYLGNVATPQTVTIGTSGAGSTGANATAGGNTSIGTLAVAAGGNKGTDASTGGVAGGNSSAGTGVGAGGVGSATSTAGGNGSGGVNNFGVGGGGGGGPTSANGGAGGARNGANAHSGGTGAALGGGGGASGTAVGGNGSAGQGGTGANGGAGNTGNGGGGGGAGTAGGNGGNGDTGYVIIFQIA